MVARTPKAARVARMLFAMARGADLLQFHHLSYRLRQRAIHRLRGGRKPGQRGATSIRRRPF